MSEITLSEQIVSRSLSFIDKALDDVIRINLARNELLRVIKENKPLLISVRVGTTQECKDIYIGPNCILSVLNYYTFPVTAILDSVALSNQGKLDDALDIRPFMFSGPAPTMVIWSGTNKESIEASGYPTLSDQDAEQAFRHWLRYIFGVNLQDNWTAVKC